MTQSYLSPQHAWDRIVKLILLYVDRKMDDEAKQLYDDIRSNEDAVGAIRNMMLQGIPFDSANCHRWAYALGGSFEITEWPIGYDNPLVVILDDAIASYLFTDDE